MLWNTHTLPHGLQSFLSLRVLPTCAPPLCHHTGDSAFTLSPFFTQSPHSLTLSWDGRDLVCSWLLLSADEVCCRVFEDTVKTQDASQSQCSGLLVLQMFPLKEPRAGLPGKRQHSVGALSVVELLLSTCPAPSSVPALQRSNNGGGSEGDGCG